MLKFAGLKETGKQYTEGSVTQIILVSFYYFDGSYGSRILVPYFGTLLLLSFIDIIVTSGSYIPMTKTIFKTLSGSNGSSHRTNNLKNAETEVTAIDDQRFSFVKVTFSKFLDMVQMGYNTAPSLKQFQVKVLKRYNVNTSSTRFD